MNPISDGRMVPRPLTISPVIDRGGRCPAVQEAGPTDPGGEAALNLDQKENKSPCDGPDEISADDAVVVPVYSGGKLDPKGGMAARLKDLQKFQHLGMIMKLPVFLTITVNREKFESAEQAFNQTMRWLSRLVSERLGVKVWGRVAEVQTRSGDGWIHWHLLIDVGDTRYDASSWKGRAWVDLKQLRADVMRYWCHNWRFGGEGSQDVQPVRKRQAVAGYLSKYVVKPWPAIPQWVLRRKIIRLVGFSLAANRILRQAGLLENRNPPRSCRPRQRRPITALMDRLAASGLTSKVIQGRRWLGNLHGTMEDIVIASLAGQGVRLKKRVYCGAQSIATKAVAVLTDATTRGLESINAWLDRMGVTERCEAAYHRRLAELWHSWSSMRAKAGIL